MQNPQAKSPPWAAFLNLEVLQEVTDGDHDIEARFVALFMQALGSGIAKLEAAISLKNSEWEKVMHELKGAAANIHAETMRDICKRAEFLTEVGARRAALDEIKAEHARYQAFMK